MESHRIPAAGAALAALVALVPGLAEAGPGGACGGAGSGAAAGVFPVRAAVRGGPADFRAGGGYRSLRLDLTNTTRTACGDLHPVLVLVDRKRALEPARFSLQYADGDRWRGVPFEETDRDERIGLVGGEDGPGITSPPGGTVSVRLRIRFAADAVPDRVTVVATAVQRRGDDGEWVGESEPYEFTIRPPARRHPPRTPSPAPPGSALAPVPAPVPDPAPALPSPSGPALAATGGPGSGSTPALAAVSAAALLAGFALRAAARCLRAGTRRAEEHGGR